MTIVATQIIPGLWSVGDADGSVVAAIGTVRRDGAGFDFVANGHGHARQSGSERELRAAGLYVETRRGFPTFDAAVQYVCSAAAR